MSLLFKDFSAITWDAVHTEQCKVAPNRDACIAKYSDLDLLAMGQHGSFFRQPRRFTNFTALSNATTVWVPGGDHDFLTGEFLTSARGYLGNMPESLWRSSGEPECTHGLGAADLSVNYGGVKLNDICFDEVFSTSSYKNFFQLNEINTAHPNLTIIEQKLPEMIAVVQYLHDILENYKEMILRKNWKLSASHVVKSILSDGFSTAPGMPEAARFMAYYLHLMTDSPKLHGEARHNEQIDRANNDKSAIMTRLRLHEKGNAGLGDKFAMVHKKMPFLTLREEDLLKNPKQAVLNRLDSALEKYMDYTHKRLRTAKALTDHGNPYAAAAKASYIKLTKMNRKTAIALHEELERSPLLLLQKPTYYGAPCGLPQPA